MLTTICGVSVTSSAKKNNGCGLTGIAVIGAFSVTSYARMFIQRAPERLNNPISSKLLQRQ